LLLVKEDKKVARVCVSTDVSMHVCTSMHVCKHTSVSTGASTRVCEHTHALVRRVGAHHTHEQRADPAGWREGEPGCLCGAPTRPPPGRAPRLQTRGAAPSTQPLSTRCRGSWVQAETGFVQSVPAAGAGAWRWPPSTVLMAASKRACLSSIHLHVPWPLLLFPGSVFLSLCLCRVFPFTFSPPEVFLSAFPARASSSPSVSLPSDQECSHPNLTLLCPGLPPAPLQHLLSPSPAPGSDPLP